MKFIATLSMVAALAAMDSIAVASDADPANAPIYYGRPNNGGYPYPTPAPQATPPNENNTATPTPASGPIYYGRPNNGG
ncbi:hypothetical protein PR003_g20222 [Phytophthora rubi]|uniref:RxLR effector protein n=1 Tax=Phytophthora rubi TaxID=129364 RepID=A0A6A3IU52_9STRA|nr:hypothetical protein PR001_g22903 [Phytophthora rubi]KAE8995711.1 hypothetical protein PR002_g19531 [Phytophthora rubi]KAE9310636.1 hypothetical protein PR003_g20222 [Phytophthora rubi]